MARTLRWGEAGKPVATDGPFAESKEQLGGFWILECGNLDEAVEWAGKAPIRNGALEVRPIVESGEEARRAPSAAGPLLGLLLKPPTGRTSAR